MTTRAPGWVPGPTGYSPAWEGCTQPGCGTQDTTTVDGVHGRRCALHPPQVVPIRAVEIFADLGPNASSGYRRTYFPRSASLRDCFPELWTQRHTASLRRRDGHTIDGIPGDCFRTALSYLLDTPPQLVPHFALHLNWWEEIRRWLREHDGRDLYYVERAQPEHWEWIPGQRAADELVLIGGPSPRGAFKHVCVGRPDGSLVWDPHPSREGLHEVDEFYVLGDPYFLLQPRLALESR